MLIQDLLLFEKNIIGANGLNNSILSDIARVACVLSDPVKSKQRNQCKAVASCCNIPKVCNFH